MSDRPFVPDLTPSRRDLLVGVASAGFALAAGPAAASTRTTDSVGLDCGACTIPTPTGPIPGYQARPAGRTSLPVVLVVQEIFGLHEHIRDVCRRLAKAGYLAVAPYLYHRQGQVEGLSSIDKVLEVVRTVPDAQVMSDLDATATFATTLGGDPARVAATGFCWGGRIVWLYAAHSPTLKAGVAWYGRLQGDNTPLQPTWPIDLARSLQAPVLGLYGGKDTGIPMADVERMQTALKAAASRSVIHLYPEAQHGFHADYRPSYDAAAASDGWTRLLAWFKANGA